LVSPWASGSPWIAEVEHPIRSKIGSSQVWDGDLRQMKFRA
jgi:hypothetical protein